MTKDDWYTAFALVFGFVSVEAGLCIIYHPLGLIWVGVWMLFFAYIRIVETVQEKERKP